jgi:hypothetical protein
MSGGRGFGGLAAGEGGTWVVGASSKPAQLSANFFFFVCGMVRGARLRLNMLPRCSCC